jgi:hypothetical protein
LNLRRRFETLIRFVQNVHGDGKQHHRVESCCQNFKAMIAKCPLAIRSALCDLYGCQGDRQGARIRKHMRGVRQQCQTSGYQTANYLCNQKDGGQNQRNSELFLILFCRYGMIVVCAHSLYL